MVKISRRLSHSESCGVATVSVLIHSWHSLGCRLRKQKAERVQNTKDQDSVCCLQLQLPRHLLCGSSSSFSNDLSLEEIEVGEARLFRVNVFVL